MNLVKIRVELYLPSLVELIDFSDFPWDKIDRLFSEKLEKRKLECNNQNMVVEASIYDIIIETGKGNREAIGLLEFFNRLFRDLMCNLTDSEKVLIRSNAKSMLKAFDRKYLNFVGEMAILNNLLKSRSYRLNGIEHKLPNGKSVDFRLIEIEKNEQMLIEIVNIHLDSERVENDPILIKKFLTNKLTSKMRDKKHGLANEEIIYLIPVLWGGWKDIKVYSDFYKNNDLDIPQVLELVAFLQYYDGLDYFVHHFKTVSHLFD